MPDAPTWPVMSTELRAFVRCGGPTPSAAPRGPSV